MSTNAVYTFVEATDIQLVNLILYRIYRDEVLSGFKLVPVDGYVMYDTTSQDFEIDEETGEEIPVINYYTVALLPLSAQTTQRWNDFVAVLRTEVPEDHIF